jgi:hypothetical protein
MKTSEVRKELLVSLSIFFLGHAVCVVEVALLANNDNEEVRKMVYSGGTMGRPGWYGLVPILGAFSLKAFCTLLTYYLISVIGGRITVFRDTMARVRFMASI